MSIHRMLSGLVFFPVVLLSLVSFNTCGDIPSDSQAWWNIVQVGDPRGSAYPPRWTEDGQRIMFLQPQEKRRPVTNWIYEVNSDGSGLDRILKGTEKDHYTLPHISPDGSRIVYATTRHTFNKREEEKRLDRGVYRNWEIETADLDGSDREQLTSDLLAQEHMPAWSPDGSRIAFAKNWGSLILSVNVMNADGSGLHEIVRGRRVYPLGATGEQRVITDRHGRDIYLAYRDAKPGQELIRDMGIKYGLVWSPDGSKLAYVMEEQVLTEERLRSRRVLYTVNADGTDLTRLNSEAGIIGAPAWSPDGTKLAFVSALDRSFVPEYGRRGFVGKLNIVLADGSESLEVSESRFVFRHSSDLGDPGVSWSPDGREILYIVRDGTPIFRVHIADVATGNVRDLEMPVSYASWSPDGSRIAIISRTSDAYLATVAPDGTDLRPLINRKVDSDKLYEAK